MKNNEIPKTQFALRLQAAMDSENLSLEEAAEALNISYEYMRRLTRGHNNPSPPLLKLMSIRFNWNFEDMQQMVVEDRFRKKHGVYGAIAQQFNPEVDPFEKTWATLDKSQKEILLAQLNLFVAQNRRHKRGGLKDEDE